MSIERWSHRLWVAHPGPEPNLSDDLGALQQEMSEADPVPDLVLSLEAIDHINSSHLARLLRLRKLSVEHEALLRLAGPRDPVWAVFLTTGLDKLFEFDPDVPTALADLQVRRGEQAD